MTLDICRRHEIDPVCVGVAGERTIKKKSDRGKERSGDLKVPELRYASDLASPFFDSSVDFVYRDEHRFQSFVEQFFSDYGRIFEHVVGAVDNALRLRKEWLLNGPAAALRIAKNLFP